MVKTVERLMKAVKPPNVEDWKEYLPIHAHLLGVATCLSHCRFLLCHGVLSHSLWEEFRLYDNLIRVTSKRGSVMWHKTKSATLFGLEVFLDKAQGNIAAAVDATTNAWIIQRMRDVEEKSVYDEQLLGLWIGIRLRLLGSVLPRYSKDILPPDITGTFPWFDEHTPISDEAEKSVYLRGLWQTFESYLDPYVAYQEICRLAEEYVKLIPTVKAASFDANCERVITYLWDEMAVNKAECAAIVLARVNAFKHHTKGVSDRHDFLYAIEWIITAKALEWISAFWKVMIQDVKSLPKDVNI